MKRVLIAVLCAASLNAQDLSLLFHSVSKMGDTNV